MLRIHAFVASCVVVSSISPISVAVAADEELPIRRVVLYKHGLGYFERQGVVRDRAVVRLRFGQEQMSDVLKTMTVLDRSGGRIAAIAYDSQKPPEQVLSEFAFDLRTDDVQQSLLRQLRGAHVELEVGGVGSMRGAVLGLDTRVESRDGTETRVPRLSLVTDTGEIRSADLFDVRSLKFEDEALASEVLRYLGVLRSTHRRDQKSVELVCDGAGERTVFVSYAVEQPVWKATYRLVVPASDGTGGDEDPYLQGWAVVDNPSDDDWNDVTLSLVAGLPVSFRHDLYTPQYRSRPELAHDADAVLAVEKLEALGYLGAKRKSKKSAPLEDRARYKAPAESARRAAFANDFASMEAASVTREIGDLLEYQIDHPVSIPRNRSALLPIVSDRVKGERLALYNEEVRDRNPLSAVRLENTTGLTLEGGPLTVLEGETYAGESLLDSLKAGERRYVAFAVELGIKATTESESRTEPVRQVTIARGAMIHHSRLIEEKTYSFDNKNDRPKVVIVEHARRDGVRLVKPTPYESEIDRVRFRVEIAPRSTEKLVVQESRDHQQGWSISSIDSDMIALQIERGVLSDEARALLGAVVEKKGEIHDLEVAIADRQARRTALHQDQKRIRENLRALGGSAEERDLRRTYVERLQGDESKVTGLDGDIERLTTELATARRHLEEEIVAFALDYEVK